MSVGKAIYNILTNDSPVSAIVSTRIYPIEASEEAAFPYIVFEVTDTEPIESKDSPAYDFESAEISCYDQGGTGAYLTLEDLTDKIITALDNNIGTFNGVVIKSAQYLNKDDIKLEDKQRIYGKRLDFRFLVQRN
jgi:hypothetical protein